MANTTKQTNHEKILPRLKAMTPFQVYLNQVKATVEPIRYAQQGMSYVPPQMGGLDGQRLVIDEVLVLQEIDFEIK